MLPAIYFIFSRKGCDEAVRQCLRDGLRLTTPDEARLIVELAESRVADIPPNELGVLGYDDWLEGLRRGIAAHHAGMIPAFKETVEDLFAQGSVKAVFATETLALGINMPARTVVIESLMKFTGERHEQMTPGEYTQLSGRAGRRGKDELGHSVVLLQRFLPFDAITRLASTRTYPLQSSFRPSYNMAVNLVRNYDFGEAEHLVNSSFAQFQADRDVVKLERERERNEAYLASYRERMRCELGDFAEYHELSERLRAIEGKHPVPGRLRGERVADAIGRLKRGDVFEIAAGKRRGRYAVVEITTRGSERRPRVLALSEDRSLVRLGPSEFRTPPQRLGRLPIVEGFDVRDARSRRELSRELRGMQLEAPRRRERAADVVEHPEAEELRAAIEEHPCHTCPDRKRHLHFAERADRLARDLASIDRRVRRRTGTLARRFELVLEVLQGLGYVRGWALTTKGETLARVYNESDLLVVEALEDRVLEDLDPPDLAAVVSTLVFEPRGPEQEAPPDLPTPASRETFRKLMTMWRRIHREEDRRGLELTREPDAGFATRAHAWSSGRPLEELVGEGDAPGDFVRVTKQLIDLLRQLEDTANDDAFASRVRDTIRSLDRGVIAYSSLDV